MQKKHILLCVAGTTPAIITETLFGLWKSGITSGDIYIITTSNGKDKMTQHLCGDEGQIKMFNAEYQSKWRLKEKDIEVITDYEGNPLNDLRSPQDNMMTANLIFEKVRYFTAKEEIILHASMGGGRKTMGFFLGQCMSWFAREEDDLSHVLVSEDIESDRSFFFPKASQSEMRDKIDYAPQPFVRMGVFLPELIKTRNDLTYEDAVNLFQIFLRDQSGSGKVTVDISNQIILLEDEEMLILSPQCLGLYIFLCRYANISNDHDPFDPMRDSFRFRHELSECLKLSVKDSAKFKSEGLSVLLKPESEWPGHWLNESESSSREKRKKEFEKPFSSLKTAFESRNLEQVTFRVFHHSSRKGSNKESRSVYWVEIEQERYHEV